MALGKSRKCAACLALEARHVGTVLLNAIGARGGIPVDPSLALNREIAKMAASGPTVTVSCSIGIGAALACPAGEAIDG